MINLDEIRKHMSQRDHWMLLSDNQLKQVHLTLADDVPDLVAEVERLQKVVDATLEFVKYIPGSEKSSIAEDALIHAVNVYNNPILDSDLKRKCTSTYSHTTHGKLTCEKDADHLNRVGDVEHYSSNVKWMSI